MAAGLLVPGIASAQTTVAPGAPAFRVPLKDGPTDPGAPAVWSWKENVSSCSTTCGTGTRTTTYECQNVADYDFGAGGYGVAEPAASCTAAIGAAPASTTASCSVYSSCSYDWVAPAASQTALSGRVGCGNVQSVFSPFCKRSDGSILSKGDHAFCSADRPDYNPVAAGDPDALGYDRTAVDLSQCNTSDHSWVEGGWSAWSSQCSVTATRTQAITCKRNFDGAIVADAQCAAGSKPAASQTQPVYDGCSYAWKESGFGSWSSTCSTAAVRTQTVSCERQNLGGEAKQIVSDSFCTAAKPASSQTQGVYDSCSYSAVNWGSPTFSSTCSTTATKTETAQCRRSDNAGTIVANSECTSRGTALTRPSTEANYSSCGYSWIQSGWGPSSNTCSTNAIQTQAVTCRRSNGDTVPDASCSGAGAKPPSSQTVADYSSCTYAAGGSVTYGGWASGCSSSTTRSVTRQCVRSNGDVVASSECTGRGVALTTTETGANYASCSYAWQVGGWSASSSTCSSSAQQTRSVYCQRSDGPTVADSSCNAGTRPASAQTVADYSGCGYAAYQIVGYGGWSSTCSASATRTQYYNCRRADGTIVADAECTNRGIGLANTSAPTAVYSGCDYNFVPGAWSDWSSHCSANARRARAVWCYRSDGTMMDPDHSGCYNAGKTYPGYEEYAPVYDGCGYAAGGSQTAAAWSSTCSANASRNVHSQCIRGDGTAVADAECTNRGIGLDRTETSEQYSGCSYTPIYGGWSACSGGTQSRTNTCRRSDGTNVDPQANCGIPATQSQGCTTNVNIPVTTGTCAGAATGYNQYSTDRERFMIGPTPMSYNAGWTAIEQKGVQLLVDSYPATNCAVVTTAINTRTGTEVRQWQGYSGGYVSGSVRYVTVTK